MIDVADRTYKPDIDEIEAYIGNPLFRELCDYLMGKYKAKYDIAYSGDKILLGWNIRLYRAGKTLCRLYPKSDYFSVLVVVGRAEKERVEHLLPEMSVELQRLYRDTREGMGQRWLLIDLSEHNSVYTDLLRLVDIRSQKA